MKNIPRTLFAAVFAVVIALTLLLVVPVHATGRKELSPQTKEKLNQLVKQRAKLDQLGAKPRFLRGHGQSPALLRQAATAAMASGRKASDGIISVPHFDFTAVSGGQAFPLMFVGSTPTSGGRSTAITNVIIPIAITVPLLDADGNFTGTEVTFDGSTKVANTVRSPSSGRLTSRWIPKPARRSGVTLCSGSLSSTPSSQIPATGTFSWLPPSSRRR